MQGTDDSHQFMDFVQKNPEIDSRNKTLLIKKNNEFFLNDLNFMPVYEINSLKMPENETFDIFPDELYFWDD